MSLIFPVLDASFKIPAGLMSGKPHWLGDYEQCNAIDGTYTTLQGEVRPIQGHYCKVNIGPKLDMVSDTVVHLITGLILGLYPANERRRYFVTASLIGWAQTYNQPCYHPHHWPFVREIDGFPCQRANHADLRCFLSCQSGQHVDYPMGWDVVTLKWRH